jgi:acetyl esterase/lipase
MKQLRILAASLLLVLLASACATAGSRPSSSLADLAYGPHEDQAIDVYLPEQPEKAPVIFMVHGGGWGRGDKTNARVVDNKVKRWLPQGYIFVSANNRLLPDADPVEQAEDLGRALAFAQKEAPRWGGDPDRFILMGHSAGAHLVGLLAADPAIAFDQGARPWLGTVPLDSAAFDVAAIMAQPHLRLYDRAFGEDPAFWREASPMQRLTGAPAPMLLVCSTRRVLPCDQARNFAAKAKGLGGDVEVLAVDMSHGEINKDLGVAGTYTEKVEAFLHRLARP